MSRFDAKPTPDGNDNRNFIRYEYDYVDVRLNHLASYVTCSI